MRGKPFTFLVLFLLVIPICAMAGPKAQMDETRIELYKPLQEGREALGRFVIRNMGDSELTIEKVDPS